jgi:hypothetical protein
VIGAVLFVVFLIGAALQVRRMRAEGARVHPDEDPVVT